MTLNQLHRLIPNETRKPLFAVDGSIGEEVVVAHFRVLQWYFPVRIYEDEENFHLRQVKVRSRRGRFTSTRSEALSLELTYSLTRTRKDVLIEGRMITFLMSWCGNLTLSSNVFKVLDFGFVTDICVLKLYAKSFSVWLEGIYTECPRRKVQDSGRW
jgi:hypothetical protein